MRDCHIHFNMIKYRKLQFTSTHAIVIIHVSNKSQGRLEKKPHYFL